ncbi:MAG: argininosuccinate synthase [Candidatus Anstonellales archaeon]
MQSDLLERIRKSFELEYKDIKRCAIAYSGGIDSTAMALILQDLGIEIVTVSLDLGQNLKKARQTAPLVCEKNLFFDAKEDLLANIKKGVWANTLHEGFINSEGLSRPIIAKYLVKAAEMEGCDAVVHGSSGSGNDQFRMENSIRVLAPHLRIIAPVRDWNLSREDSVEYVKKKNVGIKLGKQPPFSIDENLWCRTIRYGLLSSPSFRVPEQAYNWTKSPQECPSSSTRLIIDFKHGFPDRLRILPDKKYYKNSDVFLALNKVGGKNGIGRYNSVQDNLIGLKSHKVFECPAATIITMAHKELERLTLTSKELELKNYLDHVWSRLVYDGGWYTRLRHALEGFISYTQNAVTGTVELSICRGTIELVEMSSSYALYDPRLSSRAKNALFDQRDSRGFAKLWGLQDIIAYRMDASKLFEKEKLF